ncbi:MAG: glycosyltransferase, partial [Clostridia bacterium]|nr:glycosyltransferase [Clostridia bacterium]
MKILVMSFGSDAGGIEKSLVEFLHYLAGKDVSVDLYLWRKPGVLHSQITNHASEISYRAHPGSLGNCLHSGRPLANALWYAKFRIYRLFGRAVKAFKSFPGEYDIAISYCQNGYSPHYVIDKVKAGKKYLWYHHGDYGGIGRKKRIDGEYFAKYDKVIAVSRACEQMLLGHFPHLDGKTTVIHNLINENEIIEKAALPMDEPWLAGLDGCKIVTVGRVSPEKGQVMAIETARVLKRRGFAFQWIFVGDGPDFDKCQRLAERLGVKEQCHFVGVKTNPYPYMKIADVYVQPSVFEADPITIAEALTLERFIIASDIPSMQEAL